ncbi:unnamed protein product [Pieris macdunnoughi]|uniref:Uncharacterized protein n=1 Tax=Pieris macdunnoughi TaxID=345717 RepID=A0A821X7F0_9NEOP|nr:unnamed protein product [Pieris macdunnoughi]
MDIVKCNNCNIVICELLAFVQNKADVMDEDSILHATRLLRDIIKLQDNVLFIKENYATKEMVLSRTSGMYGNKKREAAIQDSFECNSDPIGLSQIISTEEFQTDSTNIIHTSCIDNTKIQRPVAQSLSSDSLARRVSCHSDLSLSCPTERPSGETGSGGIRPAVSPAHVTLRRPARIEVSQPSNNSYSDAASRAPRDSEVAGSNNGRICKNDDWVLVQRKRKNRFTAMKGKADNITGDEQATKLFQSTFQAPLPMSGSASSKLRDLPAGMDNFSAHGSKREVSMEYTMSPLSNTHRLHSNSRSKRGSNTRTRPSYYLI